MQFEVLEYAQAVAIYKTVHFLRILVNTAQLVPTRTQLEVSLDAHEDSLAEEKGQDGPGQSPLANRGGYIFIYTNINVPTVNSK